MKVNELIEQLKKWYDEDDSLIVAYWSSNENIPKKDWPAFADYANSKMDWSADSEYIDWMWGEYKKERKELT